MIRNDGIRVKNLVRWGSVSTNMTEFEPEVAKPIDNGSQSLAPMESEIVFGAFWSLESLKSDRNEEFWCF